MNEVPEELLKSIIRLIQSDQDRGNPPPSAEGIAVRLGRSEGNIKRACLTLESHGLVRASRAAAEHTNPSYTISREGTAAVREAEGAARDEVVNALLRATARVFKSDLGVEIRLGGGEVREDQATTEDLSIFIRVSGRFEGSIFFGLDRGVAREILTIAFRRPPSGINEKAIRVMNTLVNRIADAARRDFEAAGYIVHLSPASTVQPVGTRITTLGVPQIVATLQSKRGPIMVHVSLREVPERGALAA
ncbi:MAG: chemotaxis protein CheX [Chloroflexi bacterium]|nr:chemotaxis protein CheX [Chloroflexota bacterium]